MSIEKSSQLIQEELVRQIRDANRWSAAVEAWQALCSVKRMTKSLLREQEMFKNIDNPEGATNE